MAKLQNDLAEAPELLQLMEIVPHIQKEILVDILRRHEYDMVRATDVALRLTESLVVYDPLEQGINGRIVLQKTEKGNKIVFQKSNVAMRTASVSTTASGTTTKSTNSQRNSVSSPFSASRTLVNLPSNFLRVPKYRVVKDNETLHSIDFTVHFNRQDQILGIMIGSVDGEIVVNGIQTRNRSQVAPSLAMEAGVKVGDVLTGMDSEYFSPGVEVQDVMDIMHLSGKYITLHFRRSKRRGFELMKVRNHGSTTTASHPFTRLLVEQQVIAAPMADSVDQTMSRLKDRIIQWDSGFISQKIINWKLYQYDASNNNNSVNSANNSSNNNNNNNKRAALLPPLLSPQTSVTSPRSSFATPSPSPSNNNSNNNRNYSLSPFFPSSSSPTPATSSDYYSGSKQFSTGSDGGSTATTTTHSDETAIIVQTKNLRPALSIQLLYSEERGGHTVYVTWVMDVRSGVEWMCAKRYSEFYNFRKQLVTIRPSIAKFEFPSKTFGVSESTGTVAKRLNLFQKFLRKIVNLVCSNSLHPSTAKIQLALQDFLEVNQRLDRIRLLENTSVKHVLLNTVQVYVHSVMHIAVMDKVFSSSVDNFYDMCIQSTQAWTKRSWTIPECRRLLEGLRESIDQLHEVLVEGTLDDCHFLITRILRRYRQPTSTTTTATTATATSTVTTPVTTPGGGKSSASSSSSLLLQSPQPVEKVVTLDMTPTPRVLQALERSRETTVSKAKLHMLLNNNNNSNSHSSSPQGTPSPLLSTPTAAAALTSERSPFKSSGQRKAIAISLRLTSDSGSNSADRYSLDDFANNNTTTTTTTTVGSAENGVELNFVVSSPLPPSSSQQEGGRKGQSATTTTATTTTAASDVDVLRSRESGRSDEELRLLLSQEEFPGRLVSVSAMQLQNELLENRLRLEAISQQQQQQQRKGTSGATTTTTASMMFMETELTESSKSISENNSNSKANTTNNNNGSNNNTNGAVESNNSSRDVDIHAIISSSVAAASSSSSSSSSSSGSFFGEEEVTQLVSAAIRKQVECELYVPCLLALRSILRASYHERENRLQRKIKKVQSQPQSFFGISGVYQSPSGWSEAVDSLRSMRSHLLPIDKLDIILETAKKIPVIYQHEHPVNDTKAIGADDFLPIFIFVLVKAQVSDLMLTCDELQILCDPDKKLSECGYYLATLEASIQHIIEADITSNLMFPYSKYTQEGRFSDDEEDDEEEDEETTTTQQQQQQRRSQGDKESNNNNNK